MYKIYAETNGVKVCIHDDTVEADELKVLEPKLHLQDSNAGSLDFKLAPNNVAFQPIKYTQNLATVVADVGTAVNISDPNNWFQGGIDEETGQPGQADTDKMRTGFQDISASISTGAESLRFSYLMTNKSGEIDLDDVEKGSGQYYPGVGNIIYPKDGHTNPDDDFIDVSEVAAITVNAQYQKYDQSMSFTLGGLSNDENATHVDSDYMLHTGDIAINNSDGPHVDGAFLGLDKYPFYVEYELQPGINKDVEWCMISYYQKDNKWVTSQKTFRTWVTFSKPDDRLEAVAYQGYIVKMVRVICRYKDGSKILPGDFVSATLKDALQLGIVLKLFYMDGGTEKSVYIPNQGEPPQPDAVESGTIIPLTGYTFSATRTKAKVIIYRTPGHGCTANDIALAKLESASMDVMSNATQKIFWYDSSGRYIPPPTEEEIEEGEKEEEIRESSDIATSYAIPDGASQFKIVLDSISNISASNLRSAAYIGKTSGVLKTEYTIDAISRMQTTITVFRDLTETHYTNIGDEVVYTSSSDPTLSEMFSNGFIDYDGVFREDEYTLISDYIPIQTAFRAMKVNCIAANQNESHPAAMFGFVAYDSGKNFLHSDRWFTNNTYYVHEGWTTVKYARVMIRYIETEHAAEEISASDFASIGVQQARIITNRKEREIWEGRIVSEDIDFWNNRVIHCEGEMAYLNDTLQPARAYDKYTTEEYVKALIAIHNSKSRSDHQFLVGTVWAPENSTLDRRITQYETTLELLNKLVEEYGGHLYVHKGTVNGKSGRVIEWLENFPDKTCTQTINFGENLLDFTRSYDMSQMCTVVMPTGEVIQEAQSSKAGDPMPFIGGKPTYGQLLYKGDDGRVYIQKGKNLGGYKTAVVEVAENKTYYFSGRLHGGYVAYTIKSNRDGTGDYYEGGTVTAGSANEVGFVDFIDKEVTIPAGAHSIVMCSYGNDIQLALKSQVAEVAGLDVLLTVEKIADDIETVTEGGQQVKKTWHVKGSPYVSNPDTIAKYGWIEKRLDLPDITTEQDLYDAAKKYLKDGQFEEMTLEVSAIDMSSFGALVDDIMLLDQVRVISEPHNLDRYFPVTEIDIPLDNPADQKFTLGTKHEVSLTEVSSSANEKLKQQVMKAPSMSQVIKEAKKNAADYISKGTSNGYINFVNNDDGHPCEFVISNIMDFKSSSAALWRWNYNGLMFSPNGYDGDYAVDSGGNITVGITNDGRIVANDVTAATLNGVTINGSTINGSNLTLGGTSSDVNRKYVLVTDEGVSGAYVRIATPTTSGGTTVNCGMQFGTTNPNYSPSGDRKDYASFEENRVNIGGRGNNLPCLRILGNEGLVLATPTLMTSTTWGPNVSYKTGVNQTVSIDGKNVEITNGLITNIS